MKFSEFQAALENKFRFDGQFYDDRDGEYCLAYVSESGPLMIEAIGTYCLPNPSSHFASRVILEGQSEQFILIEQPGQFQGRIFYNLHDEGLFSLDSIDEWSEKRGGSDYGSLSPDQRIERAPFFQNPIADSLDLLLGGIREMSEEEFWGED